MKRIMNRIRVFQLVCLAVLAVLCGGCIFTALTSMGNWGDGSGGGPGDKDFLIAGALDLVTAPVQAPLVALCVVNMGFEWVIDHTGENGKRLRAAQRWKTEREKAEVALTQGLDALFSDARYFSSENTPQREVLIEFLNGRRGTLSTQQVVAVAWQVMGEPDLFPTFKSLCARPELMDIQRKWCLKQSVKCLAHQNTSPINSLMKNPALTDEELDQLGNMNLGVKSVTEKWEDRKRQRQYANVKRRKNEEMEAKKRNVHWEEEANLARTVLNKRFDEIFSDDRFFSLTNTPQREVLVGEFFASYRLPTQQVARVVWRIMETPELLPAFAPICRRGEMPRQLRLWCLERSLEWAERAVVDPFVHITENPALTTSEQDRILDFLSSWLPPNERYVPSRVRSLRFNWEHERMEKIKRAVERSGQKGLND